MDYTAETLENLKREGRLDTHRSAARGRLNDLARSQVTIHTGKPAGAIRGWAGPFDWQVWVEPGDAPGKVYGQIEAEPKQTWLLDGALSQEALLDAAKDRMIDAVNAHRESLIKDWRARLAQLESVAA